MKNEELKQMKFPKQLKIGGHIYKVKIEKESNVAVSSACGKTEREKGEIYIKSDLMETEQMATLLHEILHVINGELSDSLVEALSQQLFQVLKDNDLQFRARLKQ